MKQSHHDQRLDTIAFHSASPSIEASFTAAARDVFGDLLVAHLDNGGSPTPDALGGALIVIAHPETASSVGTLRELRGRGIAGPALLLMQDDGGDFDADLAELGPAAAFPAEGFALEDLESCVRALDPAAFTAPPAVAEPVPETPVAEAVAETEEGAAPDDEDGGVNLTSLLESLDTEESTLLKNVETLRQKRRRQVEALGKSARTAQKRLESLKKRMAKTQESLSLEKRQRWEVVLDLRESQERIKEVEERLQKAREGEARRQRDLDSLRIDFEQRVKELAAVTRERDGAHQRLEQAQKGLEKKSDQSRARIEELREEAERLREEHAKLTRELEDRAAGLELELEESKRETGIRAAELASILTLRRGLEAELLEAREAAAKEREQAVARETKLTEDGRTLRQRLEQVAQTEGGRVTALDAERKTALENLERRTEELSKTLASADALEKELQHLRAQSEREREESQAWIAELERELERVRGEHATLARASEGETETLRGQLDAARGEVQTVRGQLESARGEMAQTAQALAQIEAAKGALDQRFAEVDVRTAQERDEAQARITKLQEERDRLDARLRRTSAESGKVSDKQKEIDALLAELADKEETCIALRTGNETLERQMASLRAEVVELEVAREEDAERLREMGAREATTPSARGGDDAREERDRLKRELDSLRVEAENTRRALADSDARLRKLQQEKSSARPETREKTGDLAIQQLRAELGSLGD